MVLRFSTRTAARVAALCTVLCPEVGHALDPDKPLSACSITVWQLKDGLPGDFVRAMAQTTDGYLWVATLGGVARYDGARFVRMDALEIGASAVNRTVNSARLHAGADGSLWVGSVHQPPFRIYRGQITDFAGDTSFGKKPALAFADDGHGNLLAASLTGLVHFSAEVASSGFQSMVVDGIIPAEVRALRSTRDGQLWVGTERGLLVVENGRARPWLGPGGPLSSAVSALHVSRDGAVWVAAHDRLLRIAGEEITHHLPADGLPAKPILQITDDRDGNLWLATGDGLARLRGQTFTLHSEESGLPDHEITAVLEDREGTLWVGTRNGGLAQITDRTLAAGIGPPGVERMAIESVAEDSDGALWFATDEGAIRWTGRAVEQFGNDQLPSKRVRSVAAGGPGEVWIGTERGLRLWRKGQGMTAPVAFERQVQGIYLDKSAQVWLATEDGLGQVQGGGVRLFTLADGMIGGEIRSIQQDSHGSVWVSTTWGLVRYANGRFIGTQRDDRMPLPHVTSFVLAKDGTLFLATSGSGLVRWKGNRYTAIGEAHGLPTAVIHQTVEDGAGDLWVSSHKGIFRVTRKSLDEVMDGRRPTVDLISFETTDRRAGVVAANNRQGGVLRARDGRLHFAADRGLVTVDPARVKTNGVLPLVVIEEMVADGRRYGPYERARVPPGTKNIEVHYAALALLEPHKARHRYRLEGFDHRWVEAGSRRIAYYTSLPPGRYRFRVQGANNDGLWGEAGATLAFELLPRFYETVWFYLVGAFGALSILGLAYRARVRRLRAGYLAVITERTRLARDLHDTLLQGMSAAAMQLGRLRRRIGDPSGGGEDARRQIEVVERMVAESLAETRRAVWNLREQEPDRGDLAMALRRLGSRLVPPSIAWRLDVEGELGPIPPAANDELFLLAREAIMNALKHAAPERISVSVRYEDDAVVVTIFDDGRGFRPEEAEHEPGTHFGLRGLRERMDRIGGALTVESRPGAGTRIVARVPLPAAEKEV